MRIRWCATILIVLAALPVGARQTSGAETMPTATQAPPAQAAPSPAAETPPEVIEDTTYQIGPGDVLDITVWKNADLTRTEPVRPDGKITLSLLNDVQAAGLTPDQLRKNIAQGLTKFMTTDPTVTVIVTQINSQRVYVTGEVNHAGALPMLPQMTILQALSSAGGFTQFANTKKIYMFRMVNGKQVNFPFNYKDAIHGKNPEQNVLLKSGDTIVVP